MVVYIADDETFVREDEISIIQDILPEAQITGFPGGEDLLAAAKDAPCDIAFLDIQMRGMSGIETAQQLRTLVPGVNIIFCTAYDGHYREAMEMHASGYLLKPILPEDVRKELGDLRYSASPEQTDASDGRLLKLSCFGNFDVRLPDGSPVSFRRSRAKEAFAYLVYRHGSPSTLREIAAALFEDEPFDRKNQQYMQKILSSMMQTLREYKAEETVEKTFNSIAVRTKFLDCDYYDWLAQQEDRSNQIPENFMEQYAWAEYL